MRLLVCLFPFFWLHLFGSNQGANVDFVHKGVDILFESEGGIKSRKASVSDNFFIGNLITTGPHGFCQFTLADKKQTIRLGTTTVLHWENSSCWKLVEGSILFCVENDSSFTFKSNKGSADITGPCTIIAEATSNGGYKFICLSGKPVVTTGDGKSKVPAGRLVLVLGETDALGNAYDIDLLLLLKSSLLINAFEEPPPTMKKIGLAIYSQQLRMGGKYDALIGDATSDKNLQMWVLGKKGSDTKPSK